MASSDNPDISERGTKDTKNEDKKDEGNGGFLGQVNNFFQDVGEKINETIGFGKPTADVSEIHVTGIDLEKADIIVDVLVNNPNPVPIPLVDINYLVESNKKKLIAGLIPDAGTIQARGSETIKIPLTFVYDDVRNTCEDIKPGSIIPYRVKVDLLLDVPVFGRITIPLEKTGEIPIPYKPEVSIETIRFEKFSFEETVAVLRIKFENKNDFELFLNGLDFEVWLSNVSIGGTDMKKATKIGKKAIGYFDMPITFRPKDFGSAVWDMIRGRGTRYTIKGNIDASTPYGAMKLPISKVGGTACVKTDDEDGDGS